MPRLQRPISDFLSSDAELPTIGIDEPVTAAAAKMKACRSDCVLVLEGQRLCGIFTERDFLNRVAARRLDPANTPLRGVMTSEPHVLSSQDSISWAINQMALGSYRNIPIVDDGKLTAALGVRDVMGHLFDLFVEASDRDSKELNPWTDIGGG